MSITLKIRINPPPCKHTVITVTEDDTERTVVFHDSDFEDEEFVLDVDDKRLYKAIAKELKKIGKKLSKSKTEIEGIEL